MGMVEVESAVSENTMGSKKLKIKILAKKPVINMCDSLKQMPAKSCMEKSVSTVGQEITSSSKAKPNSSILGLKRKLEGSEESQRGKKIKMDHFVIKNCNSMLTKLMIHRKGFIFNKPVNPVKLGIPDYFDIIKNPMDLGTVKSKLERNMYQDAEDFANDVKLTFSNAMEYNPPYNFVHIAAEELMTMFNNNWKSWRTKMCGQHESTKQPGSNKSVGKTSHEASRKCMEHLSSHVDQMPRQTVLFTDGAPDDRKVLSLGKAPLSNVKNIEDGKGKGYKLSRIGTSIPDSVGPQHLPRECISVLPTQPCVLNVVSTNSGRNVVHESTSSLKKKVSHDEQKIVDVANEQITSTMTSKMNKSVRSVVCKNAATSDKKPSHDEQKTIDVVNEQITSNLPSKYKSNTSDQKSDGCVSCWDEAPACTSPFASTSESLEDALYMQLPPLKALRVAALKNRFAETIQKAKNNTLLQPGGRTDVKSQQGTYRLGKRQHEETKAQIRTFESAARLKAQMEVKQRRRQREREAARIVLEKMERSVDLDDNFHAQRELEGLIGSAPLFYLNKYRNRRPNAPFDNFVGGKLKSPLERLGLYIKAEYRMGDDDDDEEDDNALQQGGDWEEGEIHF